ncbi:MAG: hypothetical protein HRU20_32030 [Pseudomonadales bacterium]|nr:hypothetical protein [Pseudomonadales bacterium]
MPFFSVSAMTAAKIKVEGAAKDLELNIIAHIAEVDELDKNACTARTQITPSDTPCQSHLGSL